MDNITKKLSNMCCLSSFSLKLIALASMTIDHIGVVLIQPAFGVGASLLFRYIGRLAFPIYCFLLVEGFFYTRSRPQYLLRMLGFAVVTELIYDKVLYAGWVDWSTQNILFTLSLGLGTMWAIYAIWTWAVQEDSDFVMKLLAGTLCIVLAGAACVLAQVLNFSYGWQGLATILVYFIFRRWRLAAAAAGGVMQFAEPNYVQYYAAFAAIPIALYNGQPGPRMGKWLFYVYYPVHLAVLGVLATLLL